MIQLNRVEKTYTNDSKKIIALRQVTMNVDEGNFVATRGPSGCGKSTLLFTAGGLLKANSGTVKIEKTDLYTISCAENRFCFSTIPLSSILECTRQCLGSLTST